MPAILGQIFASDATLSAPEMTHDVGNIRTLQSCEGDSGKHEHMYAEDALPVQLGHKRLFCVNFEHL
jgi:hypothetical protein